MWYAAIQSDMWNCADKYSVLRIVVHTRDEIIFLLTRVNFNKIYCATIHIQAVMGAKSNKQLKYSTLQKLPTTEAITSSVCIFLYTRPFDVLVYVRR